MLISTLLEEMSQLTARFQWLIAISKNNLQMQTIRQGMTSQMPSVYSQIKVLLKEQKVDWCYNWQGVIRQAAKMKVKSTLTWIRCRSKSYWLTIMLTSMTLNSLCTLGLFHKRWCMETHLDRKYLASQLRTQFSFLVFLRKNPISLLKAVCAPYQ